MCKARRGRAQVLSRADCLWDGARRGRQLASVCRLLTAAGDQQLGLSLSLAPVANTAALVELLHLLGETGRVFVLRQNAFSIFYVALLALRVGYLAFVIASHASSDPSSYWGSPPASTLTCFTVSIILAQKALASSSSLSLTSDMGHTNYSSSRDMRKESSP